MYIKAKRQERDTRAEGQESGGFDEKKKNFMSRSVENNHLLVFNRDFVFFSIL